MLRPGLIACVVVILGSAPALAGELPRQIGMYPTAGPALAMLESTIEVTVHGPIVEAVVTQKFHNRTAHATEATYVFPLPLDAAVTAMSIRTGTRTIRAAIEKRDEAQRRYEAAVRAGVGAALLDQERADVFTQTVAAIPPNSSVEVTLRFDTIARHQAGVWELVVPLVVAPRFVPGTATGRPTTGTGRAPDTDRAPDASRVTPPGAPGAGGPTRIAIHFADPPISASSPTHDLKVTGADATLLDPKSDHDAVIRWESRETAAGWVEAASDGGYAAVVVAARGAIAAKAGPVRCTLVLDRSATSLGDADAVARPLVRSILAAFGTTDRVAVAGSDRIGWSAPADVARKLDQSWSTPAGAFDLTRVLGTLRPEGSPIVLVTSGLVADDRATVAAAIKLGVPLHVIGVGPAPARATLTQLATATGGTVRFAIPGDDLPALAKSALGDLANPPPALTVTWGTLAASDVVPGILPRLGHGQAMLVLARVKRAQSANARARGDLFAIETLPAARPVDGATTAMGPLARRWARNRLDELIAQRASAGTITAHAVRYGLVSPFTSMVAIGTEVIVTGGSKRSVAVPVSVPAGMKWQQVKQETTVDTKRKDANREEVTARVKKAADKVPENKPAEKAVTLDNKPVRQRPQVEGRSTPPAEPTTGGVAVRDSLAETSDDEDEYAPKPQAVSLTDRSYASAVGESVSVSRTSARTRRGSLLAGGGLSLAGGARDATIAVGGRYELGRRTLLGGEADLLIAGGDVAGRVLLTIGRRDIARWFEVGAGVGLHLGTGVGPSGSIALRAHLPPLPRAAVYLRYDGALLYDAGERAGLSSFTLGLELGF